MGWTDIHLNQFKIHGKEYGVYHSCGKYFPDDATAVLLDRFQFHLKERFIYANSFIPRYLQFCGILILIIRQIWNGST